jgi:hypothetical protein
LAPAIHTLSTLFMPFSSPRTHSRISYSLLLPSEIKRTTLCSYKCSNVCLRLCLKEKIRQVKRRIRSTNSFDLNYTPWPTGKAVDLPSLGGCFRAAFYHLSVTASTLLALLAMQRVRPRTVVDTNVCRSTGVFLHASSWHPMTSC